MIDSGLAGFGTKVPPVTVHWYTFPGVLPTKYVCVEPLTTIPGRVPLPKPVVEFVLGLGTGLTITVEVVVAEHTPPTAVSVTETVAVPAATQRRFT